MKIVGAFTDPLACERARRAISEAGVEDLRLSMGAAYAGSPRGDGYTLSVMCDSAEDREWIDELLRRAGSTGVWVT